MATSDDGVRKRTSASKKAIGIGVILGVVAIFATILTSKRFMPPREDNSIIKIGYSPYTLNLPVFIANERGFFGDYEVEMIAFGSTDSMETALIRGDIDIASAIGTEKLVKLNQNERHMTIARAVLFNTFRKEAWTEAIVVSVTATNSTTIADLDGKSIGTLPAATAVAYCRLIAQANNIKFSNIHKINPAEALTALASGRVDALLAVEPQIAIGKSLNIIRVIAEAPVASYIHDPLLIGAHCLNEERLQSDPDFGKTCHIAFAQAVQYIKEHRLESLVLSSQYMPKVSEDILTTTQLPEWILSTDVTTADINYVVELFATEKILDSKDVPDEILYMP